MMDTVHRQTSLREMRAEGNAPDSRIAPKLERKASDRARDIALARLMGAGPTDAKDDPMSPSFKTAGPPPTLEELQRRRAESQPTTPGTPASPSLSSSTNSVQRQEARSNLMRKLSRTRDQPRGPQRKEGAVDRETSPSVPLQPFEVDANLDESDSSASGLSKAHNSIAPTTSTSHLSSSSKHRPGMRDMPHAAREVSNEETSPTANLPNTALSVSGYDSSPTETFANGRASIAPSIFRPYRHTMERDRDSAFARLTAEDAWEYDMSSGAEGESPRLPVTALTSPDLPSLNMASASSPSDRNKANDLSKDAALLHGAVGLGLARSREEANAMTAAYSRPEPGYRFPGPAPSHSFEHAALKAQKALDGSPTSTASYRSATSRPPASVAAELSRTSSPAQVTAPPIRRPRSSSLSTHSGQRMSDAIEILYMSESEEWEESARKRIAMSQAERGAIKERILTKLGSILLAAEGSGPQTLENPPRQLMLHAPVLQVVNANTVKDRYLMLFNDILLIAKPLVDEDALTGGVIPPSLETRFLVKSVVEISKIKLTVQRLDEEMEAPQRRNHPQLLAFVERFAANPHRAMQALVQKGGIPNDPLVIASLLFKTSELDKVQLGVFLAAREARGILKAYVERFKLSGIRVEDAIRSFLASLRLPNDLSTAEHLLNVFAQVWQANNPQATADPTLAKKLVISILELNDYLNSSANDEGVGALGNLFGFGNPAVSVEDYVAAFRPKDPSMQCTDETLFRIYTSIKRERLQQAADTAQVTSDLSVTFAPAQFPQRLMYRTLSQPITITIPQPDPHFTLRLVGSDLRAEPATLSFATSRAQTFQLTGLALGPKTLLFLKLGANAMLYSNVPINRTFSVERAFMKHTYQLAFVNHLNVKRKYMFSMQEATSKAEWVRQLDQSIQLERMSHSAPKTRAGQASRAVALQVLRDAIISPEEAMPPTYVAYKPGTPRPSSAGTHGTSGRLGHVRSNSISKLYAVGAGQREGGMGGPSPQQATESPFASRMGKARETGMSPSLSQGRRDSRDHGTVAAEPISKHVHTGHDLVALARQNSLLPSVLGLMNSLQGKSIDIRAPAKDPLRTLTHCDALECLYNAYE